MNVSNAWLTRSVISLWTPNYHNHLKKIENRKKQQQTNKQTNKQKKKKINKLKNPARLINYSKSYTGDSSYRRQF